MPASDPTAALYQLPELRRDLVRRLGGISAAVCALALSLPSGHPPASDVDVEPLSEAARVLHAGVSRLERAMAERDVEPTSVEEVVATTSPIRFHTGLSTGAVGDFDDVSLAATPMRTGANAPASVSASSPETETDSHAPPKAIRHERAETRDADRFIVMLDPGHGGSDPGAEAHNGLLEKDLTRDIAERVRLYLSEIDDIEVLFTREGDTGLSRQRRIDRVQASGADMLVSLHFNHLPQTDVTLVESYYAGAENIAESQALQRNAAGSTLQPASERDMDFVEGSARLAQLVQQRVFNEVAHANAEASDAGVKRETLFMLTRSFVSGALIELTCLSNPDEADRLAEEPYRERLAASLADAIRDYRRSLIDRPLGALDV